MRLRSLRDFDRTDWLALGTGACLLVAGVVAVADAVGAVDRILGLAPAVLTGVAFALAMALGGVRAWLRDEPHSVAGHALGGLSWAAILASSDGSALSLAGIIGLFVAGVVLLSAGTDLAMRERIEG